MCGEAGRKNAKRLRQLAGGSRYVQTLSNKKEQPLCSVASLDRASVELVMTDGRDDGGSGGRGTFSLQPLTHLAKLAPAVASDPTPSALVQSGYNSSVWESEDGAVLASAGHENSLHDRTGRDNNTRNRPGGSGEGAAAPTTATPTVAAAAQAARPRMGRLVEHSRTGLVDAIEIHLTPGSQWGQQETDRLARRWIDFADDQASLAKILKRDHFWGQEPPQQQHRRRTQAATGNDDADAAGLRSVGGTKRSSASEEGAQEPEDVETTVPIKRQRKTASNMGGRRKRLEVEYDLSHEGMKRTGWADLLEHVHNGRGERQWSLGRNWGRRSPGSCGFAAAQYTVGPSGEKILIHRPHEIGEGGGVGSDDEGGCLTALLAFVSIQPEVRHVKARRRSATMNRDAAWVVQSGVNESWPLWEQVRPFAFLWYMLHFCPPRVRSITHVVQDRPFVCLCSLLLLLAIPDPSMMFVRSFASVV